MPKIKVT